MVQCIVCGNHILKPEFAVPFPTGTDRRKIFATRFGFAENFFVNLQGRHYLCPGHFNSEDFFRNEHGHPTKLKPHAVPKLITPTSSSTNRPPAPSSSSTNRPPVPSSSSTNRPSVPSSSSTNRPSVPSSTSTNRPPPLPSSTNLRRIISNLFTNHPPATVRRPALERAFDQNLQFRSPTSTISNPPNQRLQLQPPSSSGPKIIKQIPGGSGIPPTPAPPSATNKIRLLSPFQTPQRRSEPSPSTVTQTYAEHDFDIFDPVDSSQRAPQPVKKKRGPYKKFKPRIINLDEYEFTPSTKKPLVVEEEKEYDVMDDERVEMVLISKERLEQLFLCCPVCKTLLGNVKREIRVIGTAGTVTYSCSKCPQSRQTWATQDRIPGKKVFRGNALLSAAANITPISFPTLKLLFNLSRIGIFGNDRYKLSQADVVWPVVGNVFNKENDELLKMLKNRDGVVNLLMDAQYDSPGFCAMMCKVTAIDAESGYAVGMQVLKKTWSIFDNVSGRMEPEGTCRVLEGIQNCGVKVDRVTTDRSTTVMAMMKENFPEIEHKRDAWHMVKGIKKDLLTEAKKKRSGNLNEFVSGIKNHFWFSISEAKGDGELCREILLSSLFHIIGVHKWQKQNICSQLTNIIRRQIGRDKKKMTAFLQKNPSKCSNFFKSLKFERISQCCHDEITAGNDENDYMDPVGAGYFYVLNKLTAEKFLKDVVLLSPDLTTSQVENFHSVATGIYTPKRTYFQFSSYAMRSALAVLHYNNNERSSKEGNRTVMRKVTYPSKAQNGEMVTKKVKSKAPIAWKHNIITRCLEVFEKGEGILEDVNEEDSADEYISTPPQAGVLRETCQEIDEDQEELEDNMSIRDDVSEEDESQESDDNEEEDF